MEPLEKHLEKKDSLHGDLSVSWGLFQITVKCKTLAKEVNKETALDNLCVYTFSEGIKFLNQ